MRGRGAQGRTGVGGRWGGVKCSLWLCQKHLCLVQKGRYGTGSRLVMGRQGWGGVRPGVTQVNTQVMVRPDRRPLSQVCQHKASVAPSTFCTWLPIPHPLPQPQHYSLSCPFPTTKKTESRPLLNWPQSIVYTLEDKEITKTEETNMHIKTTIIISFHTYENKPLFSPFIQRH